MATAASEVAVQPEPDAPVAAAPEAPVAKLSQNRLDKRFRKLTKTIYQEREVSRCLNILVDKYDQLARQQRVEIKELKQGLERAIALVERYQRLRPITPNPDRYTKGTK